MVWQSNHIDLLYEAARRQFQPRPGAVVRSPAAVKTERRKPRPPPPQPPEATHHSDGRSTDGQGRGRRVLRPQRRRSKPHLERPVAAPAASSSKSQGETFFKPTLRASGLIYSSVERRTFAFALSGVRLTRIPLASHMQGKGWSKRERRWSEGENEAATTTATGGTPTADRQATRRDLRTNTDRFDFGFVDVLI